MQTTLETIGQLERRLNLTVPVAAIENEVEKRLARLAKNVKVPGFRPGKVPMKMVAEHKAVYIDVRSKEQYDISHIKGAISIPLSELPTRWKDLPVGKFLITYCA